VKIMSMTTYKVPPRWLFLKIETQSGYIGWGEPVVEGRADTVEACIHELKEYVIGRSAGDIEDIWQVLYRGGFYRGGPVLTSALSGIDQALWDIKGKYYNMPIYEMLGGKVRDKMRVYRWIGGDRPDNVAEEAQKAYKEGYNAVKMNGTDNTEWIDSFEKVEGCVKRVAAIREKMGYKLDIAVDFHGRIHKAMARILMKELEPFHLMFIEEPVLIENYEAFKDLRNHTVTPIATGERGGCRGRYEDGILPGRHRKYLRRTDGAVQKRNGNHRHGWICGDRWSDWSKEGITTPF
jgi:galactonate dehydratase